MTELRRNKERFHKVRVILQSIGRASCNRKVQDLERWTVIFFPFSNLSISGEKRELMFIKMIFAIK